MSSNSLSHKIADNIRILALSMVEKASSGHPGGAMGGADFAAVLFSEYLRYDPEDPAWIARDRFFLDPGHLSSMLYSVLAMQGFFTTEELQRFRQWGSPTPGHPELDIKRGIENGSGPLGQGHTMAVGAAIAAKKMGAHFDEALMQQRIYAFISDGGIQEEISQGAGRLAGHLGLDNLIMFYDANEVQLSTRVDEVDSEDVAMKYRAWGWEIFDINGNDPEEIRRALDGAIAVKGKPSLIIGHTLMAKGAIDKEGGRSLEDQVSTHGQPLSKAGADIRRTIAGLGGDPDDPFVIFPEVQECFAKRRETLLEEKKEWQARFDSWRKAKPEAAEELERWLDPEVKGVDWSRIKQAPDKATRNGSATVLGHLAEQVPNMIVSSADLSNSDKTDGFLKKTTPITRDNYDGQFINMGVSELTMAVVSMGLMLHGGLIAACGTFFVFSDYMKPAIRLCALMELPVKFVWTHDAFRVGEDGPTHQPIEQEAQIRLMEKLRNHSGNNAMLVLRPADVEETTVAWKMAMENTKSPTALIFSRQNIKNLPENDYTKSLRVERGGYTVVERKAPEAVLIASGSEVSTLVAGAELLRERGIEVNVASIPSEGLFRRQPEAYQESVLLPSVPRYGLTAGLPVTLEGMISHSEGRIHGMESFGFSAPYTVLDEKFGYTAETVCREVMELLGKK